MLHTLIWSCINLTYSTASSSIVLMSTCQARLIQVRPQFIVPRYIGTNYRSLQTNTSQTGTYLCSIGNQVLQGFQSFIDPLSPFLQNWYQFTPIRIQKHLSTMHPLSSFLLQLCSISRYQFKLSCLISTPVGPVSWLQIWGCQLFCNLQGPPDLFGSRVHTSKLNPGLT